MEATPLGKMARSLDKRRYSKGGMVLYHDDYSFTVKVHTPGVTHVGND